MRAPPRGPHSWLSGALESAWSKTCRPQRLVKGLGLPQGDPASPILLSFLLLYGSSVVESSVTSSARLLQAIYMDDRTLLCDDPVALESAIALWSSFAERHGLKENPCKTQRACIYESSGMPGYLEVLGCIVGCISKEEFARHPKHRKKIEEARRLNLRIHFLPLTVGDKMRTTAIFTRGMASYGWVERSPPDSMYDRFNISAWKSVGRFLQSLRPLRTIFGTFIELEPAHFINIVRLKLRRDRWLEQLQLPLVSTGLDYAYLDLLQRFGWYIDGSTFHHEILDYTFEATDISNKSTWQKAAHALRQSCRWLAYTGLSTCGRYELAEDIIPPFDLHRMDVVRKMAAASGRSLAVLSGAVVSGKRKSNHGKIRQFCHKCRAPDPCWNHIWECGVGQKPPEDVLKRRFAWPLVTGDLELHMQFLKGADAVLGGG
eukprot:Skav227954  [mRNA]  locus=scaffold146:667336:668631:+ [translate_table: standard]